MTRNDWKDILRSAHNEPIDAAHYTAVRSRVIAEIERSNTPWRRLAWIFGVTAFTLVLLLAIVFRPVAIPAPPLVAIAIPAPPPLPVSVRAAAPPPHRHKPAPHREPFIVKLQTSDPNIVIYWIAE